MANSKNFKPYVPADKVMPELTFTSIILGALLAVIFGGANAYLGLRVGMTVSASIPAAVVSMGIIRKILRKDSILENNMVQTIGSAGESLAAGAIFTLPALFMWADENSSISAPHFLEIAAITICGGLLGVLFMVPLRTALIVEEHGTLPFPEGTACAEVLLAGESGGSKSKIVFSGLGIAAAYKFIADGLRLFPSETHWEIKKFKGSGFGIDVLPALAGVGYICGIKIAGYMFSGGIIAWFVLMPLISLFGGDALVAPSDKIISEMSANEIWSSYVRYIGAGAVAAGGIISLIKTLPTIIKTFRKAITGFGHKEAESMRTNRDLPMPFVIGGALVIAIIIWIMPSVPISFLGALIIVIFGFFFATVSSRMVGLVGSSNNPVSGMAIATLLIATALLKATGTDGYKGMASAICIGTVICIVAAMAGDTSQDLKTGYIVGATPIYQQIGELVGAVISGLAIGGIMYLLNNAWGYSSTELPAPQASLMKLVVEGVMGGSLPWGLVFCGIGVAVAIEILGLPILPVAIGLYLPIHLSSPIFIGGIIRWFLENKNKNSSDNERKSVVENGILYSSGLIAGEGLVGILLAVLAIIPFKDDTVAGFINLGGILGNTGGIIFFILLLATLVYFSLHKDRAAD